MAVLLLCLGAVLLLWSHIIWLVLLLLSLPRYAKWHVEVEPDVEGASSHGGSSAAFPSGNSDDASVGHASAAPAAASGASVRRRGGWLRRLAPWKSEEEGTQAAS